MAVYNEHALMYSKWLFWEWIYGRVNHQLFTQKLKCGFSGFFAGRTFLSYFQEWLATLRSDRRSSATMKDDQTKLKILTQPRNWILEALVELICFWFLPFFCWLLSFCHSAPFIDSTTKHPLFLRRDFAMITHRPHWTLTVSRRYTYTNQSPLRLH